MENTECLFSPEQSTSGMVSISQLQSFMSCPKKWEYGYMENLTPRVERPYLGIGKLCHKGMEMAMRHKWRLNTDYPDSNPDMVQKEAQAVGLYHIEQEWKKYMADNFFLDEEIPEQERILSDAQSIFSQAFAEFDPQRYEVLTVYRNGEPEPALELHFVVPCADTAGLHGYIDAILSDTETGNIWCTDYKFRKSLSPDEEEAVNIQNVVYTWACHKMGINVTGTMTWQHVNTPASNPSILKNGSVSKARIKTTWEHYKVFCLSHGIDPAPYEDEMKEKLSDIEWFRPTIEFRNGLTVKNMLEQVVIPAAHDVAVARTAHAKNRRNLYPWNCKMCQFKDLCQAELRGHDADFLRDTEYTARPVKRREDDPTTDGGMMPAC